MYGAIIGDIVGSRFEFSPHKSKEFQFFHKDCTYTDDTVMTIAVAKALYESKKNDFKDLETQLDHYMHEIGKKYPNCGFGGSFYRWIMYDRHESYNSFGNGSAMRTSYCAEIAGSLEEALDLSRRCAAITHDHPEGIKGAQATTAAIFLAGQGKSKEEIRQYIKDHFYELNFTLDQIRPSYSFDVSCQGSVPEAIECFLEAKDYEDCIRNAVSLGGDCDTQGAIAGAIAEAYFGLQKEMIDEARKYLDPYLLSILDEVSL